MDYDDDEEYYPEPEVCPECGYEDYWCDLCGYHGHDCDVESKEAEA